MKKVHVLSSCPAQFRQRLDKGLLTTRADCIDQKEDNIYSILQDDVAHAGLVLHIKLQGFGGVLLHGLGLGDCSHECKQFVVFGEVCALQLVQERASQVA
jgi:hypothetical protein